MTAKTNLLIIANGIAFAGVLVVNYLANALPIAGRTPAEVSDMYPTLFTPAGITFAIWGVIYLLLLGFVIYSARFFGKPMPAFLQKTGWWFAISCLANMGWLFAFHHLQFVVSIVIILVLLWSLITIYQRVATSSGAERWFVKLPFSVYLGWITVATIANASILLTYLIWNGMPGGPQLWTILVLIAAVGIGMWLLFNKRDFAFALVIIWALFGILSERMANFGTDDGLVERVAMAGMGVLALGIIVKAIRLRKASL